jgi:hypothetical protein
VSKVLHLAGEPDSRPVVNQRRRCFDVPWVKASGTTYPWVCSATCRADRQGCGENHPTASACPRTTGSSNPCDRPMRIGFKLQPSVWGEKRRAASLGSEVAGMPRARRGSGVSSTGVRTPVMPMRKLARGANNLVCIVSIGRLQAMGAYPEFHAGQSLGVSS